MQHEEFFFEYKKYTLFGQYWMPDDYKAIVLLVHGMGEHSSRYADYVVPELLAKQFGVITYDNFGHGKSSGKRGHCPGYASLMEVISMMFYKAKEIEGNTPVFLYGHSMGGNLIINYVLRNKPEITGAIATSPFLRLAFQPPAWKMTIGKLLQKIAPSVTLPSELDVEAISRIPDEVKKYQNDPLIHDKISPNFSFPIIEAGSWAIDHADMLETPMLLVHGTDDKIIDYTGTQDFSKKTSYADLVLFDKGYHELHNDIDREKLIKTIVNWIENNL
ncbi:alpha/beta hydrolase [Aquimarina sp. 2201CG14-23]|uniref:alpha/beta hydrolase n=1 Tax=Aquimarina mycalae TaxID=3040073 RepID=UPI0024781F59|nr:alpha/beta hydrolase [Aquimarina sp. 2201CG14-23]MDH7446625.1 alpha/beta hydrolase [Aquimarina sp. 2201CG14-23]